MWAVFRPGGKPRPLLHALLTRTRPDDDVREFHGSLRWAEFLLERSDGQLRPGDHVAVGSDSIFDGLGDWVFSGSSTTTPTGAQPD
ncbi:hypothetical protein NLX86_23035 [Streptomyces sp. A3M-1-3]|uniref:hypothetical protein n=1 Tax=Streptomyces sp. A3M-1-3 TaxID=2962044 RepID=UPI0020B6386D|nr:hypothetical protein [Streptomyces sp. A3M-1-3]MCP3820863.1 hypothetical protein [Streptomyces sp. A3M-1-3]